MTWEFGDEHRDFQATCRAFVSRRVRPLVDASEVEVRLEAARLLTYQAAARLDVGHPKAARTVASAKYLSATAANKIVDDTVQLFGGAGFIEESPVARHYRDVRILRIAGGTDEIQLEILARA